MQGLLGNLLNSGIGNLIGGLFGGGQAPTANEAPAADQAQITGQKEQARTEASAALAPQPTINQQRALSIAQFIQTLIAKLNPLKTSAEAAATNPATNEDTLRGLLGNLQDATMKSMNDWMRQEAQKQQAQAAVPQAAPNPAAITNPTPQADIVTANGQTMGMKPNPAASAPAQGAEAQLQQLLQVLEQLDKANQAPTAASTVIPSTTPTAAQIQAQAATNPAPTTVA